MRIVGANEISLWKSWNWRWTSVSSSVVTMNCLDVDALTNNTSIEEEGKKEFQLRKVKEISSVIILDW